MDEGKASRVERGMVDATACKVEALFWTSLMGFVIKPQARLARTRSTKQEIIYIRAISFSFLAI
jgi:hypothetical protein